MKNKINKICFTFFLGLGLAFCYSNVNASTTYLSNTTGTIQGAQAIYNMDGCSPSSYPLKGIKWITNTNVTVSKVVNYVDFYKNGGASLNGSDIWYQGVIINSSNSIIATSTNVVTAYDITYTGTMYQVTWQYNNIQLNNGDSYFFSARAIAGSNLSCGTDILRLGYNDAWSWGSNSQHRGYDWVGGGFYSSDIPYYIEINDIPNSLPPCTDYSYSDWGYCNESGRRTRTISSSIPTACNYTDVESVAPVLGEDCTYVAPVYPDTSFPFTIVSPFTFSYESTAKVDYTYNTDVFTPYDYIEIRRMSSDWSTSTFIATSSPTAHDFSSDGHSFFTLTGDPEIRGRYNYEVTGYFAPYYLPGVGDMPATSSIPVIFSVYWQKTQIPTPQEIIDYEHTVSTELAHGVLYESSCTDSEWATPDPQVDFGFGVWTFPALNFTRLQCSVKLAVLELGTKVIDKMTGYFTKIGNMLKNVFPFNIYTNLNEAWENSAYAVVLPELSFLSPVNGNLSVQVPNGVTGSSTYFVLWGSSIFTSPDTLGTNNADKASTLFGAIRTIIKWSLWGLFGFWVVRNGQAFVKKLTGGE